MITIAISENIEVVIVDGGAMCIKDKFFDKSVAILPDELEALSLALENAKTNRVYNKFIDIAKKSNVKICTCSGYQLDNLGCRCGAENV